MQIEFMQLYLLEYEHFMDIWNYFENLENNHDLHDFIS